VLRALDLRPLERRRDRTDDALGHLVLQREDVIERAFEAVRPEVASCLRIDELPCDADAIGRSPHTALEHVSDTQLATDLLHVHRLSLVGEARVAGDDEEP
jgi:hypothetical protein